jgi:hypothetical protein
VYVVLEPATSLDLITFTDPFAESFGHAALRYQRTKFVYILKYEATKLPPEQNLQNFGKRFDEKISWHCPFKNAL